MARRLSPGILCNMSFGVFIHRTDSVYDDVPAERYQFPSQYLARALQCVGDWIIYLEPAKVKDTKGYFAVAKVQDIIPDPRHRDMHLAIIEPGTYLDFGDPVPFRVAGAVVESGLLNDQGKISGRAQSAIRTVSPQDFASIVGHGLGKDEDILPRLGEAEVLSGFAEPALSFQYAPVRERINQLINRAVRDRNFRKVVLRAYRERCAITGMRLINGQGRAEVEAAHIRPVEYDGPDIVSNGIALSGTAHWMFDRGLVGFADNLTILVSRQVNDPDAIKTMVNSSGKLIAPNRTADRPRTEFLSWHRENRFKH